MIFLSGGKKKLFQYFYDHPLSEIHLRELSRLTKVSVDNCFKFLNYFTLKNYLTVKHFENKKLYRINFDNPFTTKIMELFDIEQRILFYSQNSEIKKIFLTYLEIDYRNIFLIICFNKTLPFEYLFVFIKDMNKEKADAIQLKIKEKCYFLELHQFESYCKYNAEFNFKLNNKKIIIFGESNFWHNLNLIFHKKGIYSV